MLRISALILCLLAAATLDWTSKPRPQVASGLGQSFSLVTIRIDRSEHFVLPAEPASIALP